MALLLRIVCTVFSVAWYNGIVCMESDSLPPFIRQITTDFAIGSIAGAGAMTAYSPWGYCQNRKIQNLPVEWSKPNHWFRGLPGLASGKAPVIAVQMASYGAIVNVIFTNIYMILLPMLHKRIALQVASPELSGVISGTLTGALVALSTQPFMVVVTKMHADIEKKEYPGMLDTIHKTYKQGGVRAFYSGSGYRSMGVICAIPVLNLIEKQLKALTLHD